MGGTVGGVVSMGCVVSLVSRTGKGVVEGSSANLLPIGGAMCVCVCVCVCVSLGVCAFTCRRKVQVQ